MQSDRKFPPVCWCHSTRPYCVTSYMTAISVHIQIWSLMFWVWTTSIFREKKCQNFYPTGGREVMFHQNISTLTEIVPLCSWNNQNIISSVHHYATCFWLPQKCSIFWETVIVFTDCVLFGLWCDVWIMMWCLDCDVMFGLWCDVWIMMWCLEYDVMFGLWCDVWIVMWCLDYDVLFGLSQGHNGIILLN